MVADPLNSGCPTVLLGEQAGRPPPSGGGFFFARQSRSPPAGLLPVPAGLAAAGRPRLFSR